MAIKEPSPPFGISNFKSTFDTIELPEVTSKTNSSSIDDGILIDSLLGAGQGNELSGDFSANISLGYRIKNGKLIGRIKNTMLSGNAFDALSKINHLSLETENIFGTINLPYLCTNNVEISS